MANTLKSSLVVGCYYDFQRPVPGFEPIPANATITRKIPWSATGAGAGQCDELYAGVRTLGAGASENLDLAGALTNLLGDLNITFARVKGMMVYLMTPADTADDGVTVGTACSGITLGAAAANPWLGPLGGTAPTFALQNGMVLGWATPSAAGFPVVAGTGDVLKVTNNDGAVAAVYQIFLFGAKT